MNDFRERLRNHPECVEINMMGEKRPFLLTMYGLEIAAEKGENIIPPILDLGNRLAGLFMDDDAEDIEVGSQQMTERLTMMIRSEDARTLALVVWWGLITFDDEITLKEVQMMLTPGTLVSIVPKVVNRVNKFAEDQLEEESALGRGGNAGGEDSKGKSPGRASNESASVKDTLQESTIN